MSLLTKEDREAKAKAKIAEVDKAMSDCRNAINAIHQGFGAATESLRELEARLFHLQNDVWPQTLKEWSDLQS